jgi:PAS domain S-box-containing protein
MAHDTDLILSFFDSTDAVMYLKDAQGRFVLVNRRAAELAGLSKEEFVGKTAYDVVPKDEADRVTAVDQKVRETGAPLNFTDTVTVPSGKLTLLDHKFPVPIDGYPNAVGGIAIEISEEP